MPTLVFAGRRNAKTLIDQTDHLDHRTENWHAYIVDCGDKCSH